MATFLKTIRKTVKNWYIPALIGVLFVILGFYLFTVPEATYFSLVLIFSISFLSSGILDVIFAIQNRDELDGWGWYLAGGILSILVGGILVSSPLVAATTLPFFIGFSLLFRSIQGLGFAFEVKNYGALNWGNLAIVSVLGIVFSFLLIANPVFAGLSLVVMTALTFIFVGISAIVLAFQLKKVKSIHGKISQDLRDRIDGVRDEYYRSIHDAPGS